jgi:hypothetical protein
MKHINSPMTLIVTVETADRFEIFRWKVAPAIKCRRLWTPEGEPVAHAAFTDLAIKTAISRSSSRDAVLLRHTTRMVTHMGFPRHLEWEDAWGTSAFAVTHQGGYDEANRIPATHAAQFTTDLFDLMGEEGVMPTCHDQMLALFASVQIAEFAHGLPFGHP